MAENKKTTAAKKKSAKKKNQGGISQQNLTKIILVVALFALAAGLYYWNTRPSSYDDEAYSDTEYTEYAPPAPVAPSAPGSPPPATPLTTVAEVTAPPTAERTAEIIALAEEYLRRYDQAVENRNWSELTSWTLENKLYVEASILATIEQQQPAPNYRIHDTSVLLWPQPTDWELVTQKTFEETIAHKAPAKNFFYDHIANQINAVEGSGGLSIANLSRLAGLLVQADCAKGRELYLQCIKDDHFYDLLIRAIREYYFTDIPPDDAWRASWYRTVPMNLWLIDQLIAYNPTVPVQDDQATGNAQPASPPHPPLPGHHPGMTPRRSSARGAVETKNPALFEHRLLLLQILSRRGGIVSAHLMRKLFEADQEDQTLLAGLLSNKMAHSDLFSRFTGIYAEPLIDPLARGLEKYQTSANEWDMIASVLARMLNDRASYAIFASAKNSHQTLSEDLTFFLAVNGSQYTLENLSEFYQASRVRGLDIQKIFSLWTDTSTAPPSSLWDLAKRLLPDAPSETAGPDASAAGRPPMPPPTPFGLDDRQPAAQPVRPARQEVKKTHGLPVNRRFIPAVDSASAKEFLKMLGKSAVSLPGDSGAYGHDKTDPAKNKSDAVRCLTSLYDNDLRGYFREMIADPDIGGIARLGLCALKDHESGPLLLEHFVKNPLDLNKPISPDRSARHSEKEVTVSTGNISVPLDTLGLPTYGVTARDALIFFNHRQASEAFLTSLNNFIVTREPFNNPEQIAEAACQIIEALGHWSVKESANTLADLIESTGDFGLRSTGRTQSSQDRSPLATQVRIKATGVLGKIGNPESMDVLLRISTFPQRNEALEFAARIALAYRGIPETADMFIDMIDPYKTDQTTPGQQRSETEMISSIDSSLNSKHDIATLALSRTELNAQQINRVVGILKKLAEPSQDASRARDRNPQDQQEKLFLSLLSRGQGAVLRQLTVLINDSTLISRGMFQPMYYWNQNNLGDHLLKMAQALGKSPTFEDQEAVVLFVTAMLRRIEASLTPETMDFDQWNPAQDLMQFSRSTAQSPPRAPIPPTRTTGFPRTSTGVDDLLSEKDFLSDITVALPRKNQQQNNLATQQAAIAALTVISTLEDSNAHLKSIAGPSLPFHVGLTNFLLWQTGDRSGYDALVALLSGSTDSNKDRYAKFYTVEQIEQFVSPDVVALFGQGTSRNSDPMLRARLCDGAAALMVQFWKDPGHIHLLIDPDQAADIAKSWKPVVDLKNYDRQSANSLIIALAPLQSHEPTLKWIQDIIRTQCTRAEPVSEQAVEYTVGILYSLNPTGNASLLELYVSILTQTVDLRRQQLAQQESVTRGAPGRQPTPPPTPRPTAQATGVEQRRSAIVPAYEALAPTILQAISRITLPDEVLFALTQLSRSRSDLLGHLAIEIHKRDPKQGQILIRRLLMDRSKEPEMADQVKMVIAYILMQMDEVNFDLLVRTISRADPSIGETAFAHVLEMIETDRIPGEGDPVQIMKTIVQSLQREIQRGDIGQVLTRVAEYAQTLGDRDLDRMLDRLKDLESRQRQQTGRYR